MAITGSTFRQLIDEVLEFQFAPGKYETLVKRWLNQAQRKAVIQSEFRTQETAQSYETTAEDGSLALPEDFGRFIDFIGPEGTGSVTPLSREDFDSLPVSSGRPAYYLIRGNELLLYPTPDAGYDLTLRYWRLPQDMEADGDEPEIPVQYHEVLIAYAMQKAYARENDYTASNFWKAEWEAGVGKMRGEAQSDTFDGPKQVEGSWAPYEYVPTNVWS